MGNVAGESFFVLAPAWIFLAFFAGSITIKAITAECGVLTVTGLSATGGPALLLSAGLVLGIVVVSAYVLR